MYIRVCSYVTTGFTFVLICVTVSCHDDVCIVWGENMLIGPWTWIGVGRVLHADDWLLPEDHTLYKEPRCPPPVEGLFLPFHTNQPGQ